jgi:hypothetical protein
MRGVGEFMMRRAIVVALTAALAFVPAALAGGGKANTRVTIDAAFSQPDGTYFSGDIFSPRKACKNNRPVQVFRVRGGADQRIGQTRSFRGKALPGYFWTLYKEDQFYPSGRYYAKVKPTTRCKGDRSAALASDF